MKSKFDYHVSLADALRSKDLRHLRDFSICILDMEDEEVDHLELEPLVAKIVGRFHEDMFAACPRLCRVVLPTRLCGMGKGAFRDDGALMEFSVPKDHYPIVCENHMFDNCPCPDEKLAQLL